MLRLIRPEWLALGLMLVVSGCSAPGAGPRAAATPIPDLSTSTQVVQVENPTPTPTSEGIVAETLPAATPTVRLVAETPEGATVPTELSGVSVVKPSAEDDVGPLETPMAAAIGEGEAETPGLDEAGVGRGPTDRQLEILASLQSYGPGPELPNDVWLNSEPLELANLRGKVVLVEFWTFG